MFCLIVRQSSIRVALSICFALFALGVAPGNLTVYGLAECHSEEAVRRPKNPATIERTKNYLIEGRLAG